MCVEGIDFGQTPHPLEAGVIQFGSVGRRRTSSKIFDIAGVFSSYPRSSCTLRMFTRLDK